MLGRMESWEKSDNLHWVVGLAMEYRVYSAFEKQQQQQQQLKAEARAEPQY